MATASDLRTGIILGPSYTIFRRTRIFSPILIETTPGSFLLARRARVLTTTVVDQDEEVYIARRSRVTSRVAVSPLIARRARVVSSGLDLDYAVRPVWQFPFGLFREELYAEGIGSIECEDLNLNEFTNEHIKLNPGFFYNDYKEYFAYGDDYTNIPLVSGTIVGDYYRYIMDSGNLNWNVPPTIVTIPVTTQFVPTNNPVDSGTGYRKVCDLSAYTESADGLSPYTFTLDSGQYIIDDTGEMIYYYFPISDTGYKYVVTSDSGIIYDLPDIYQIPYLVSGFLVLTDDKILITPNSLVINIPKKQYTSDSGEYVSMYISIRGSRGEMCADYPLLINGVSYTTNTYGATYVSLPSAQDVVIVTDTGVPLPDTYDSSSYNIQYVYHLERIQLPGVDETIFIRSRNII